MAEFWGAASAFFAQYDVLWRVVVVIVACLVANWLLRLVLGRAVRGVVRGVKKAQDVDSTHELAAGPLMNARAVQRTRTLGTFGRNIINWSTVIPAQLAGARGRWRATGSSGRMRPAAISCMIAVAVNILPVDPDP